MINKSIIIIGIIFYISVIFITSSPLQHQNLFKNEFSFSLTNSIQLVYAADDDGGDDDKGDDDDGGDDDKGDDDDGGDDDKGDDDDGGDDDKGDDDDGGDDDKGDDDDGGDDDKGDDDDGGDDDKGDDDDGGDDDKGDDDDGGDDDNGDSGDDVTDTSNFRSANDNDDEDKKSSNGGDDVTETSNLDSSHDYNTNDRSDNSKFIADVSDDEISTSDESSNDGNSIPGESEDDGTNLPGSGDGTNLPGSGDGTNLPGSGDGTNLPGSGDGTNLPGSGDGTNLPGSGDGTNPPVIIPVPVTQTSSKDYDDDNDDNDFKKKVKNEYKVITKKISKNKVIVRDHDNNEKEIVIISNKNTCPTQSNTVELKGKIGPHGIRLLADFDPCKISDGSVTFNIPNTKNIKLAAIYIDKKGIDHAGTLIDPMKIQNINRYQGLYTIELDNKMKGTSPVSGKDQTLTKINALALYNNGDRPIQFKAGNTAALTATFTK